MSDYKDIKFGTDGWRGIIADDFTYDNVRRVGAAIAAYVLLHGGQDKGIVIGYDTRFGSRRFAELVAEVLATAAIPVRLATDYTPTPALSYVSGLSRAGNSPLVRRRGKGRLVHGPLELARRHRVLLEHVLAQRDRHLDQIGRAHV